MFARLGWLLVVLGLLGSSGGCSSSSSAGGGRVLAADDRARVAYVTNGIASFWVVAEQGAQAAARQYQVDLDVRMPPQGVTDQKRMVQELLAAGVDGIAISPIDPTNQGDLLAEIAAHTRLITHDSDAPASPRLCYIGMDNYTAGRMCGQLVKEALPDGGELIIFVGRLGQDNARLRRQGVIDELLDRSPDPTRYDPPGAELRGERYVILDTRTDEFDFAKAKSLAQDAIARYPDLDAMAGLFAYNPTKCLEAVREAGKAGSIQIIGFDEEDDLLQGILDGHVHGTVVQNPYQYGFESVRVLNDLAHGRSDVIPASKFLDIPARKITRENVVEFRQQLRTLLSPPSGSPGS